MRVTERVVFCFRFCRKVAKSSPTLACLLNRQVSSTFGYLQPTTSVLIKVRRLHILHCKWNLTSSFAVRKAEREFVQIAFVCFWYNFSLLKHKFLHAGEDLNTPPPPHPPFHKVNWVFCKYDFPFDSPRSPRALLWVLP